MDHPTPPPSPMAEMRPAPARAGDHVFRPGEYARLRDDLRRQREGEDRPAPRTAETRSLNPLTRLGQRVGALRQKATRNLR